MAHQGYHCKLTTVLSVDDVGSYSRLILKVLSRSNRPRLRFSFGANHHISPTGSMVPAKNSTSISRPTGAKLDDNTEETHRHQQWRRLCSGA